MFMEKLVRETERLSLICSMFDTMRRADQDRDARGWTSPIGLLKITRSCAMISELATAIAKAGYRECDRQTLEEILGETRQVLYALRAQATG
ncbi:hypothetical protein PYR71_03285 [Rhizobium sp. MC63]|uniref:Four helix bundle protein n=2 Tax=Rhizobium TaxID=379 RepID=A0A7W8XDK4_9HYPH|nr:MULTISPECIES: hypothetical protein [Rhizobium]MBB4573194.1 hypothetical protein [Rhizobium lentis]MBB5549123.1 hypothetical protein [Rhizobium lentis]MBB5559656.1 hypothetical protein [Rhizobium lentis]MBB5566460.1 hypothetical protein [Rhizobium lentis]MDF0695546.1 hypothetical protein [Rhizobium sp. MC63]